jgi:membrane protease YdiL (CAAX protease family)
MMWMMYNTALIGGAIAAGYWFLRSQSIHKGFGLTIHWWSLVDLLAGFLISALAMGGIFLVTWLSGGLRVEGFQLNVANWNAYPSQQLALAAFEEIVSRMCQQSGLQIALALLLAFVLRGRLGGSWERRVDRTLVWTVWPAILVIATVFGYIHLGNANATPVSAFGNALGGLMYGIAFAGGRNLWLPIGMHFGWNVVQGAVLGFPMSGSVYPSLITLQGTGPDLLTGGAYGPEGGLIGMGFRFVIIAMVLGYLYLRAGRRGNVARLEFPIAVYDNPPGSRRPLFGGVTKGAAGRA